MTTREILTIIANGKATEETATWAAKEIEKLDARNAKRKETPSKTALANAPLKEAIYKYLCENEGEFTSNDLGAVIDASFNKAGALARQLVAEGKVKEKEVKIPKKGVRKAYFVER